MTLCIIRNCKCLKNTFMMYNICIPRKKSSFFPHHPLCVMWPEGLLKLFEVTRSCKCEKYDRKMRSVGLMKVANDF